MLGRKRLTFCLRWGLTFECRTVCAPLVTVQFPSSTSSSRSQDDGRWEDGTTGYSAIMVFLGLFSVEIGAADGEPKPENPKKGHHATLNGRRTVRLASRYYVSRASRMYFRGRFVCRPELASGHRTLMKANIQRLLCMLSRQERTRIDSLL